MSETVSTGNSRTLRSFNSVLGSHRGNGGVIDIEVCSRLLRAEGLDVALAAISNNTEQLRLRPKMMNEITEYALELAYVYARPSMHNWLRSVGVRPRWALNLIAFERCLHFLPDGHLRADSQDLLHVSAACGAHSQKGVTLTRGTWSRILRGENTAGNSICEACAVIAGEHHETSPFDEHDPLPGPILARAHARWCATQIPRVHALLLEGTNEAELMEMLMAAMDEIALAWAARILSRYPLPNTLRALRSNGFRLNDGVVSIFKEQVLAEKIAALALDENAWATLLRHHLHSHFLVEDDVPPESRWAETLLGMTDQS